MHPLHLVWTLFSLKGHILDLDERAGQVMQEAHPSNEGSEVS